jgi:RND family efflux transporter MFP subunit
MDEAPPPDAPKSLAPTARAAITAVAVLVLAGLTAVLVGVIWLTEPEPEREGAVKRTAMLVEVDTPDQGTFRPTLQALGSVRPFEEITLQPRVSGQVLEVAPSFVPGRVVEPGELLLQIDPADARNALAQRRSALQQAEAALKLERGRQAVAKLERDQIAEQLKGGITDDQEQLILRAPQLDSAQAAVESARAAVRQAELDLQRTAIVAPFRALVLDRTAHTGSQVGPSTALGRLVGTERFWVELTLPTRRLPYLEGSEGDSVILRDETAWGEEAQRTGRLESVIGQVDAQTRMARVLISVDDPLALDPETDGPPLMSGTFVQAELPGQALPDVVRIERGWLRRHRGEDAVWTLEDGQLRIRPVEVLVQDDDWAYIGSGLTADAQVVTTDLSTVTDGAPLRIAGDAAGDAAP